MIIKNIDEIATTRARRDVIEIIEAGIARVLPDVIMQSAVNYDRARRSLIVFGDVYPISGGRLFVIGGGKAANLMAVSLEKILGYENIADGIVTCKDKYPNSGKIKIVEAGHPIPDQRGVNGVKSMLHLKEYRLCLAATP